MALNATFTADFGPWQKALDNAKQSLQPLIVSSKGLQAQLERMTKSFSGADVQKQANLAVAAVEAVGGAAKLTASEQSKLNAQLTEAIAKYAALGQTAPQGMLALADATKKVETPTDALSESLSNIGKEAVSFAAGFASFAAIHGAVTGAFDAITGGVEASIEAFSKAESAQKKLTAALTTQGTATPKVIAGYNDLATTFQKTTVYSDDLVNEMEALLTQVGNVMPSQMEAALTASTNLASGLGIDLHDATLAVGKALEGNTTALQRFGVHIDEAALKTQGADAVFQAIQGRFGGQAQAELDTYSGRLKEMANAWDNVKEEIGRTIVLNPIVEVGLRKVSDAVMGVENEAGDTAVSFAKLANSFGATPFTVGSIALVEGYASALNEIDKAVSRLKPPPPELFQPPAIGGPQAQAGLDYWNQLVEQEDKAQKAAEQAAEAFQKLKDDVTGAGIIKSLRDLNAVWTKLTPAEQQNAVAVGEIQKRYVDLASHIPDLPPSLHDFAVAMNAAAESSGLMSLKVEELKPIVDGLGPTLDSSAKAFKDWGAEVGFEATIPIISFGKAIKDIGQQIDRLPESIKKAAFSFTDFGSAVGDALTRAIEGGGDIGKAIGANLGKKISEGLQSGPLKDVSSKLGKFFSGALGAVLPGIGSLLGGLADKVFGKLFGADRKAGNQLKDQFQNSFGSLDELNKKAHDAGVTLNELFAAKGTKQVQAAIDHLNAAFEKAQKEVEQLDSDLTKAASSGELIGAKLWDGVLKHKDNADVQKVLEQVFTSGVDQAAKGFNEIAAGMDATNVQLSTMGPLADAAFGALLAKGDSVVEALDAMGPGLDAINTEMAKNGETADGALGQIEGWRALTQQFGDTFTALQGVNDELTGLSNSGLLTQQSFDALAQVVDDAFATLTAGGAASADALQLMQPELQKLWEASQTWNLSLDDGTQALLDQAEASGLVGEKFKPAAERMADSIDKLVSHLDLLIKGLGIDIPDAADQGAKGVQDAFDGVNIQIPVDYVPGSGPGQNDYQKGHGGDGAPSYASGSGGLVDFGTQTWAKLHGREAVLTEDQFNAVMGGARGGGAAGSAPVIVNVEFHQPVMADNAAAMQRFAQLTSTAMVDELRRRGVRVAA
jgi:hypothetical protein